MSIPSTGLSQNERRAGALRPLNVSVRVASQLSGLSVRTIWNLIRAGRLDVARIGGRTLPSFKSLEGLLTSGGDTQPERPAPAPRRRGRPRKEGSADPQRDISA
jgi:hypothetical protein